MQSTCMAASGSSVPKYYSDSGARACLHSLSCSRLQSPNSQTGDADRLAHRLPSFHQKGKKLVPDRGSRTFCSAESLKRTGAKYLYDWCAEIAVLASRRSKDYRRRRRPRGSRADRKNWSQRRLLARIGHSRARGGAAVACHIAGLPATSS